MEHLEKGYAELLHSLPFNPYSQHCIWDKDNEAVVWKISALTNEAAECIIQPLMKVSSVQIKALNVIFHVIDRAIDHLDLKTLAGEIYEEGTSKVRIDFYTPTAFKSKGEYVFMPSTRLVFQNLFMRYGYVYGGDAESDEDTISYIEKNAKVISYRLRSQYFAHAAEKGRAIPAFMGSVTLRLAGPPAAVGLARMLLKFGEYSGAGIKTSMGMGAMACTFIASRR